MEEVAVNMEITLRDIYNAQQQTQGQVGALSNQVATFTATVNQRLDSGGRDLEDHEERLRTMHDRIPPNLISRLEALERFRWSLMGVATTAGVLSGAIATLIAWALTHH